MSIPIDELGTASVNRPGTELGQIGGQSNRSGPGPHTIPNLQRSLLDVGAKDDLSGLGQSRSDQVKSATNQGVGLARPRPAISRTGPSVL